jgi:hypothetical protein
VTGDAMGLARVAKRGTTEEGCSIRLVRNVAPGKHMYNVTFIVPLACKGVASNQAVPPQPDVCADGKRPCSPTWLETKRRKADCDD